jgi:hypothetical protein
MGGNSVPDSDVKRRFTRSLAHFLEIYAPLADGWTFRNNSVQPASLLFDSANSTPPASQRLHIPMKPLKTAQIPKEQPAFIARGQAAAKAMAKELRAEHKRWNLPLLSWKDGKVVATKP